MIDSNIMFDANFENGSMDRFIQLGPNWYHIKLRPDTWYWFHFRVKGCKDRDIIFEFTCGDVLSPGYAEGKGRWLRSGHIIKPQISYDGVNWEYVDYIEKHNSIPGTYRFRHQFSENEAYICYTHPYTYTDMLNWTASLDDSPFVNRDTIGKSRNGLLQPLLTITDGSPAKDMVVLIGREDADEVTSSWAIEGIVQQLLAEESKDLLQRYTFKIIPMVCVDGVAAGGMHSAGYGYGGKRWHEEPAPTEIENVKQAIKSWVNQGYRLQLAGKIHGGQCLMPTYEMALAHIDVLTSNPELRSFLTQNTTKFWQPRGRELSIRPKGYFERFMLDEFDFWRVFSTHVQGTTCDSVRGCGKGLMRALSKWFYNR